jgi:GTPase SAR1 family protein
VSENKAVEELKYHEKLNIPTLSIAKIKELIKSDIKHTLTAWAKGRDVEKQCYHVIGPAGVGKTAICKQITDELVTETGIKFGMIMIKAPVLSRDDLMIPFPVKNKDGLVQDFKMLYSDFVPKNKDSYGLFIIDEFSRGDHTLQQLMWQIQNEYMIHRYAFPKGWFVVSIDNPDDAEYQMDTMEDAAGLRRQLHVYTEVNVIDFLNYAMSRGFHPLVIEFIQTHPERIYDFASQKKGMVYANPASWEKLSDHLWKMQDAKEFNFQIIEQKAGGLLNVNMAQLFIEFARDQKDINPKDVFFDYNKVKPKIKELIKEGNNSKLSELMSGFVAFLATSRPEIKDVNVKNVVDFLCDIPIDVAATFLPQTDRLERRGESFRYITDLHRKMNQTPRYKTKFFDTIVAASEGNFEKQKEI